MNQHMFYKYYFYNSPMNMPLPRLLAFCFILNDLSHEFGV